MQNKTGDVLSAEINLLSTALVDDLNNTIDDRDLCSECDKLLILK